MNTTPHPHAHIGCAGWSLPRPHQHAFPESGTHLERYGARFTSVEINSSFYRPHQRSTYTRWSDSVPSDFRFSVKVPKTITHVQRLEETDALLDSFVMEATGLGEKLGCLLVQLPPSLQFKSTIAERFFRSLADRLSVPAVCEPRHRSWFTHEADSLLLDLHVARVAADPAPVQGAGGPGGWRGLSYYRLHGSPRIYYSAYSKEFISATAQRIQADQATHREVWCIFDNTADGAATANALELMSSLNMEEFSRGNVKSQEMEFDFS